MRVTRLLESHSRLANNRRGRSQCKLFLLLQAVARNVYNALRFSFGCSCPVSHGVNMQLIEPLLVPHCEGEALIRNLDVRLALTYDPKDTKGKRHKSWVWDEVSLRISEPPTTLKPLAAAVKPSTGTKKLKSVMFSEDVRVLSNNPTWAYATAMNDLRKNKSLVSETTPVPAKLQPPELIDLCHALARKQSHSGGDCHGYVTDPTGTIYHKFGVYRIKSCNNNESWFTIPLKQLLYAGSFRDRKKGPRLQQQLHLAATVAASILQLHGTPWLPGILSSDNIFFLQQDGVLSYDRIYVSKTLPDSRSTSDNGLTEDSAFQSRAIKNPMVFSLGILLIEIILCETLDNICSGEVYSAGKPSVHPLLRSATAEEVLYQVELAGTEQYRYAVESCLKCNFDCLSPSLDDEGFREAVYNYIVAPLQDSSQMSRRLPGESRI